jgi:hypothetical protein
MVRMATPIPVQSPARLRSLSAFSPALRIIVMTLLFTAAACYEALHLASLCSYDIWWHLRTGLWILQNHAVPHNGLFSQYPDLPWIASSWGFDVLVATAYKLLGLRAIPILLMALKVALAVVTFLLARGVRANFWAAVILSAVAQYVIVDLQPLPIVFSMLLLGIELLLLFESRRTGNVRPLFWLPPLFCLWANLHTQFVCGLLLLGVFLGASCLEEKLRSAGVSWLDEQPLSLPLATVGLVTGLSVVCTLATPYTFHIFPASLQNLYSRVSFHYFDEMRAMNFRRPQDYALMLLVMTAFFALGRKRRVDIFNLTAIFAGTVLAFRIQRDAWLVVLIATPILANGFYQAKTKPRNSVVFSKRESALAIILTIIVIVAAAANVPAGRNALMSKIGERFPVRACNFIRKNHLPGPLFNAYSWGGFLTWYMPEYPVAIDGRLDLYGNDVVKQYFKVTSGNERLETDPGLTAARTLLLEQKSGMTEALTTLPRLSSQYRVLYTDDVATVFARQ